MEKEKKLKEYSRCLRCGRRLKKIEYRQRGYGEVCWKKVSCSLHKKPLFNVYD